MRWTGHKYIELNCKIDSKQKRNFYQGKKLAFASLFQRGFCKLTFSVGVQDANNHNELQSSCLLELGNEKSFYWQQFLQKWKQITSVST